MLNPAQENSAQSKYDSKQSGWQKSSEDVQEEP